MPLIKGTWLGPYQIEGPLGAGGMGEVYRARDTRLGREVAVKILPPAFARDPDRLRRFEQEARVVAALNHPNIVAIHDIGTHSDGSPFLVSELLEGEPLRQRLASGALPARKAIEYGTQIAEGLSVAHEKGVVHRDLKPENLFLTKDGRVKILDFGLAKLTHVEAAAAGAETIGPLAAATEAGVVLGTAGYMSPEQVRGEAADHRADIFSLGAVLYEMFSGRRAFERASSVETMHAILKEEPPAMPADERQIPPAIQRILEHCLEKERERRFQSARDLAFALGPLSDRSSSVQSGIVPSPAARPARLAQLLAFPMAGLLIGALCFTGGLLLGKRSSRGANWRVLPLTAYRGLESQPALSPDGNQVAFIWDGGIAGRANLYVRLIDGGVSLLLAGDGVPKRDARDLGERTMGDPLLAGDEAPKRAPIWSPDGKKVAFLRGQAVYIIPALGGTERKLLQLDRTSGGRLGWSPDGRFIAVTGTVKTDEPVGVLLISTESGEFTALLTARGLPIRSFSGVLSGWSPTRVRALPQCIQRRYFPDIPKSGWDRQRRNAAPDARRLDHCRARLV